MHPTSRQFHLPSVVHRPSQLAIVTISDAGGAGNLSAGRLVLLLRERYVCRALRVGDRVKKRSQYGRAGKLIAERCTRKLVMPALGEATWTIKHLSSMHLPSKP